MGGAADFNGGGGDGGGGDGAVFDVAALFAAEGPLAAALGNYQPREGQIAMAMRVAETLEAGGARVLEAGTGIGKTFAYLAPIICSGRTALVSTGARALQDQLSQSDIPVLGRALGRNVSWAVLKGRANYVCKKALEEGGAGELFGEERGQWQAIRDFSHRSEDGDIRGIRAVPSDSRLLRDAVSTRESCNTQACPHYEGCFLYKARARARQADIVIVNHHLFLSDVRLRDEGVAELLPSRDVVLFDEAHLLPQLAPRFFGESLSGAQVARFVALGERLLGELEGEFDAVLAAGRGVRAALGPMLEAAPQVFGEGRVTALQALECDEWREAARRLLAALAALGQALLGRLAVDEKVVGKLAEQALSLARVLRIWLGEAEEAEEAEEAGEGGEAVDVEGDPLVRWGEYRRGEPGAGGHWILYVTPMTGREMFARQWEQLPTVLFTSATLSVGGEFRDFCEAVGLAADAPACSWDSPYDFARRSLLYLPPGLPAPNDGGHTAAVVEAALPLVVANGGRAFVLFSSWRALHAACDLMRSVLEAHSIDLLKQGDMANDELLRCFRREKRGVLAGCQSFWQGVDVRGEALSLVVVDKIPFVPPSDPLLQACDEWRRGRGENAFMRNQLPPAALLMKQVAGRLMRDYDDFGVFMVGDPRLVGKGYGKTILQGLPPMPLCREEGEAVRFLESFSGGEASG